MSKRVNNKKGNTAKRKKCCNYNFTKIRGRSDPNRYGRRNNPQPIYVNPFGR